MPENRPQMAQQLIDIWNRLTWSQRGTIFFFCFLGIGLIGGMVFFMNRVEYQPLFRELSPEDANAIVTKLKEENIKYKLEGPTDSTTIKVAGKRDEITQLKIDIAASGIASSGTVGFEIFDKSQFGMTDFTEQINLQRALEGVLSRSVASLADIVRAQVHIVLPKDSVYEDQQEDAKASVIVRLKGSELSRSSIAGIKGIVSGAVPGLRTRNVSIIDMDDGRLLTKSAESDDSPQTELQSDYRDKLEDEMATNVISILEPLVGKNKVNVVASIDMDFNTTEQMEETYNPNAPAVLSQQKTEERAGPSTSGIAEGVPGPEQSMTPPVMQSSSSMMERVRQSEATNYEVSKTIRHTVQPKGTVRRVSVAVVLDHKTIYKQEEDGTVTSTRVPRSQEDLDKYRNVVLAAVGYNEDRGDVVTIINDPFYVENRPIEPQEELPFYIQWQEYLIPAMKYAAFIVLFLLIYLIFLRPIRKRVSHALSAAALETGEVTEAQLPAAEETAALPDGESAGEIEAPSASIPAMSTKEQSQDFPDDFISLEASDEQIERELMKEASTVDLGGRKYAAMKNKLIGKAKKDPEMVSQLIRSVLRERV